LPAICDIAGTTLMNVGLLFVAASIYQMTRGALVLFVGLFSVWFLKRHLGLYKWFSLFVVVFGVAIVGLAGAITKDDKATPGHKSAHSDMVAMDVAPPLSQARGAHHGEVFHGTDQGRRLGGHLWVPCHIHRDDHLALLSRHWLLQRKGGSIPDDAQQRHLDLLVPDHDQHWVCCFQ
jgi:hypothetical protein